MDSETGRSNNRKSQNYEQGESSKSREKSQVIPNNATGQVDAMEEDVEILDEKKKEVQSLWFLLVPKTDKTGFAYPPITNSMTILSIKRERITVSTIQDYIKEKLKLNDYTEVDILCHGNKLESEFTLKMIQFIWMSGRPEYNVRAEDKNMENRVIELGYVRSEKLINDE